METDEPKTFHGIAIKILAIIGFLATLVLVLWLLVEGAKRTPAAFSSLASIAESIQNYRPIHEFTIATEKSTVNSGESFQISWTDTKQPGEYHFGYTCTDGVDLLVRDGDGALVKIPCMNTLSLPADVHGLFLSITSGKMRFSDVPLKVTFTNPKNETLFTGETKVTVVNVTIPTDETAREATTTPKQKEIAPTPATPAPKPVTTIVYPQSDPKGFTDLAVSTIGTGVLQNGALTYTTTLNPNLRNAIAFDIKNIGTKTSGTWTFKTTLPSGVIYTSDAQAPLKPNEHAIFTLSFDLDSKRERSVKITTTVYISGDTNAQNNSSVWNVSVGG